LADIKENFVEEAILKVKQKNIPLILVNIDPETVSKVSKYYNKVAFIIPDSRQAGTIQSNILVNLWNTNKKIIDKNNDNILQYILLQGEINNPVAIDRTKYVISTINGSGIKTKI
jgi:methyl-galactoside transport system substrate-binding protein